MDAPATEAEISAFVSHHVQRYHLSAASILAVTPIRDAFQRLRDGDSTAAEWAVCYLEASPIHFNSGYIRNQLFRWLRRVNLNETQRTRLGRVVILLIENGRRPDFKEMRALTRRIDTPELRASLLALQSSDDPSVIEHATRTYETCRMNDYRADLRGAR
jgi:hypothetical protein